MRTTRRRHGVRASGEDETDKLTYVGTVLDGHRLLDSVETDGKTVFVMDFANPFSFVQSMVPPYGDHSVIHYGRTMCDTAYSPAEEMFATVDYVLMPRQPRVPLTAEFLQRIYGDYVDEHFESVGKSTAVGTLQAPRRNAGQTFGCCD